MPQQHRNLIVIRIVYNKLSGIWGCCLTWIWNQLFHMFCLLLRSHLMKMPSIVRWYSNILKIFWYDFILEITAFLSSGFGRKMLHLLFFVVMFFTLIIISSLSWNTLKKKQTCFIVVLPFFLPRPKPQFLKSISSWHDCWWHFLSSKIMITKVGIFSPHWQAETDCCFWWWYLIWRCLMFHYLLKIYRYIPTIITNTLSNRYIFCNYYSSQLIVNNCK